jgi:hypothetical protein
MNCLTGRGAQLRSTRKTEDLVLSLVMSVVFMCGWWLIHIFCCCYFGFLKEGKNLKKCACKYLCNMGILYGSHSIHYNYSLLNYCLYVKKIFARPRKICCIYIYIYIFTYICTRNNIFRSFNILKAIFKNTCTVCIYQ